MGGGKTGWENLAEYLEKMVIKKCNLWNELCGRNLAGRIKRNFYRSCNGIDQRGDTIYTDIDIVTMDDELNSVDAVIVMAITYIEEFKEKLSDQIECPVISIGYIALGVNNVTGVWYL